MGKRSGWMRTWMIENAYLVTMGCVLAMVVGCAIYTQSLREEQAAGVQAAANAPEVRETSVPSAVPTVTPLPTLAPLTIRPAMLLQSSTWPLEGDVLRPYDAQNSVYWEYLGVWQTHAALDIAGNPGDAVKACMEGTVTSVSRDPLWGWKITLTHDSNCETRYAGLESAVVQPGTRVTRGQTIGTLLESIPCEAELETHLHLEMLRDGKKQDPEAALPEK